MTTRANPTAAMLYDLNIVWTPQTSRADLERTLRFSHSLGYDVVALNHTFAPPIGAQATNPIPQLGPAHPSFPPPAQKQQGQQPSPHGDKANSNTNANNNKLPITLRRATVLAADPATNHRLPLLASAYDLLACRPTTEKAFVAACTGWPEVSLISLDLSQHQPYRLRPKPCMAAVARGALFEVCYGQLVSSSSSSAASADRQRARAVFVANVLELARATRGRGIVLSSEARGPGGLRAPADVVNLFAVWGLGPERGLEALGLNPRAVVVNEGLRKRGFRGVVDVVDAEGRTPARKEEDGRAAADGESGAKEGQRQKNMGGKKQQQQEGTNGKRKHEGASDHGGGDQGSAPAMSKRKAKKMKLAEKVAATPTTETSK